MPLLEMGAATGQDNPWWRDFVMHPTYDAYWEVLDSEARLEEFAAASLNIGGWYDVFLDGTLVSYTGMVEKGRTEYARENQKLLIGPWPHASVPNFVYDGIDFGPDATVDFDSLHVKWFDALLKGVDNGYLDEPPVRIFIMGENVWRSENEWPIARTQYTNYYFHSGGNANGSSGDGTLSTDMPGASDPVDEFVYDPMNPVPTRGGNLMFGPTPPGPFDRADIAERDDILVFTTPPLEEAVEVTGPITVTLHASSSATDTRLHGDAGRRPSGRKGNQHRGRHPARTVSQQPGLHGLRPAGAWDRVRVQHRPVGQQQPLQGRSPDPRRDLEQQLPQVRPQPEHGRPGPPRDGSPDRQSDRLPQRPAPLPPGAPRDSGRERGLTVGEIE